MVIPFYQEERILMFMFGNMRKEKKKRIEKGNKDGSGY